MVNVKNIIIGLAIFILTMFVVIYGVYSFYPQPQYEDYCSDLRFPFPMDKGENDSVCPAVCVELYEINEQGICEFNECGSGCGADGISRFQTYEQCQIVADGKTCYDEYDKASEQWSKVVFFIALPLGIILLAVGVFAFGLETVGAGLALGGVGIIIWGVGGYWRYSENLLKFLLSLVGLVIVIWLAYYFNKKSERKR
jgi:hypothetical protein